MAATDKTATEKPLEPRGFGEHTRGLAGELAHEQGWGLDVEERTKQPAARRTPMAARITTTARATSATRP